MVSAKLHTNELSAVINVPVKEIRSILNEEITLSEEFLKKFTMATYIPENYITGKCNSFAWPSGGFYSEYNLLLTNIKKTNSFENQSSNNNNQTPLSVSADKIVKKIWDPSYFRYIKNNWNK